jgi:hypothetical protein
MMVCEINSAKIVMHDFKLAYKKVKRTHQKIDNLPAYDSIYLFESLATHNSKRICQPASSPQIPAAGLLCGKKIQTEIYFKN